MNKGKATSMIDFGKFQTAHPRFQQLLQDLPEVVQNRNLFLILGEPGTGRRSLAQMIHEKSQFSSNALSNFKVELPWTPNDHVFLIPEIQDLDFQSQNLLLQRITSTSKNALWIATAQPRLVELVSRGLFRKDLYEIFGPSIRPPNLAERSMDQDAIIDQILMTLSWVMGRVQRTSLQVREALASVRLKGNVTELEHILESAVLAAGGDRIEVSHLKLPHALVPTVARDLSQVETLAVMEQKLILQTLQLTKNNKTQAAHLLGISIRTLRNKINQYHAQASHGQEASL